MPSGVVMEVPIATGDERLGSVLLLTGSPEPVAADYLHLAAVASLTDVAIEDAKDEVEQNLRGSFLEDLRRGAELDRDDVVRRADASGCDLSGGAVALCAELTTDRPRHVVATIASELPGALAQHMDGRVYALLPGEGDRAAAGHPPTASRDRRRLVVLRGSGGPRPRRRRPSSCSTSCASPAATVPGR